MEQCRFSNTEQDFCLSFLLFSLSFSLYIRSKSLTESDEATETPTLLLTSYFVAKFSSNQEP